MLGGREAVQRQEPQKEKGGGEGAAWRKGGGGGVGGKWGIGGQGMSLQVLQLLTDEWNSIM